MDAIADRLLSCLLCGVIIALITATAGAALWLLYGGILHLCIAQFPPAAAMLGGAFIPAAACYALCRHGNDLMDR
jgi:hypothetical protein